MSFKEGLSAAEVSRGMSWVVPWWRAAKVQVQRLDGIKFSIDAQNDAVLFVLVLANFIRGAEALLDGGDPGLAEFRKQVPRAVDVRDVLTHFDAYMVGRGQLQKARVAEKRGVAAIGDFNVAFQFRPSVEIFVSGISVKVPTAIAAMDVLVRYLDRLYDQVDHLK